MQVIITNQIIASMDLTTRRIDRSRENQEVMIEKIQSDQSKFQEEVRLDLL